MKTAFSTVNLFFGEFREHGIYIFEKHYFIIVITTTFIDQFRYGLWRETFHLKSLIFNNSGSIALLIKGDPGNWKTIFSLQYIASQAEESHGIYFLFELIQVHFIINFHG